MLVRKLKLNLKGDCSLRVRSSFICLDNQIRVQNAKSSQELPGNEN